MNKLKFVFIVLIVLALGTLAVSYWNYSRIIRYSSHMYVYSLFSCSLAKNSFIRHDFSEYIDKCENCLNDKVYCDQFKTLLSESVTIEVDSVQEGKFVKYQVRLHYGGLPDENSYYGDFTFMNYLLGKNMLLLETTLTKSEGRRW
ncbi:MAG: hypothetical protein EP332_14545 [Bacteroidetes bacterium]|nr:MAG: hypothetical protein EP332_14545 [Bacteroidota bacterium]